MNPPGFSDDEFEALLTPEAFAERRGLFRFAKHLARV
jgi:hypothetical protein